MNQIHFNIWNKKQHCNNTKYPKHNKMAVKEIRETRGGLYFFLSTGRWAYIQTLSSRELITGIVRLCLLFQKCCQKWKIFKMTIAKRTKNFLCFVWFLISFLGLTLRGKFLGYFPALTIS